MDAPVSARAGLLQALTVPGYGLDLIERVRRESGGTVRLRMGSVYPALQALEREGLVRLRPATAGGRGRPRRYYELTVRGVKAAMSQRESLLSLLRAKPATPDAEGVRAMRERLESCSELSMAVLELQRQVQEAKRER